MQHPWHLLQLVQACTSMCSALAGSGHEACKSVMQRIYKMYPPHVRFSTCSGWSGTVPYALPAPGPILHAGPTLGQLEWVLCCFCVLNWPEEVLCMAQSQTGWIRHQGFASSMPVGVVLDWCHGGHHWRLDDVILSARSSPRAISLTPLFKSILSNQEKSLFLVQLFCYHLFYGYAYTRIAIKTFS